MSNWARRCGGRRRRQGVDSDEVTAGAGCGMAGGGVRGPAVAARCDDGSFRSFSTAGGRQAFGWPSCAGAAGMCSVARYFRGCGLPSRESGSRRSCLFLVGVGGTLEEVRAGEAGSEVVWMMDGPGWGGEWRPGLRFSGRVGSRARVVSGWSAGPLRASEVLYYALMLALVRRLGRAAPRNGFRTRGSCLNGRMYARPG